MPERDLDSRVGELETAQAAQAATQAGAMATQSAAMAGMGTTNAAVQAGNVSTMAAMQAGSTAVIAAGSVALIVGMFLGMTIARLALTR